MTEAALRFDEIEAEITRRAERKRNGEDVSIRDLLPELQACFFKMSNEEAEARAERGGLPRPKTHLHCLQSLGKWCDTCLLIGTQPPLESCPRYIREVDGSATHP